MGCGDRTVIAFRINAANAPTPVWLSATGLLDEEVVGRDAVPWLSTAAAHNLTSPHDVHTQWKRLPPPATSMMYGHRVDKTGAAACSEMFCHLRTVTFAHLSWGFGTCGEPTSLVARSS